MIKVYKSLLAFACAILCTTFGYAQSDAVLKNDFSRSDVSLKIVGRGGCKIENGVFKSRDAYASFGNPKWKNYVVSFKARAPRDAEQVQIWAGFRAYNRNDRYVLGIKGGLQDDLLLSRMGYMGTDELLGICPLYFHPIPGAWYDVKVEVCNNRIRIFLNNENIPRMDVTDKNSNLAPAGEVTLGGGWIETEFDDLSVAPMTKNQLDNVRMEVFRPVVTAEEKEKMRQIERAQYKPIVVKSLSDSRMEISLDGNWLFMPEYQLADKKRATSSFDDGNWHVMSVPNFWNPIRIWLHGETMGPFPKGVSDTYYQQETARCEEYTFDYRKTQAAWYRQWLELPDGVASKNMTLTFDAVSKVAEVFINGESAASHVGMFGEFQVDGSKLFKPGRNLIVVKVTRNFVKDISDADKIVDVAVTVPVTNKMLKDIAHGFYDDDPAGIWQPVKLTITNPVKIEDVFIKPSLTGAEFDVTIRNHSLKKNELSIHTDILDKETGSVLYSGLSVGRVNLKPNEERMITYSVKDLKPRLWSPQHPNLYDFKFTVTADKGKEADHIVIPSGFRTFEVKKGLFYLNGHPYWLRGGNQTPFALAPNDEKLANTFYQLMKQGNIEITRTHTTPYNNLWVTAADNNGIGISYEGTWPWLMIQSSMPDKKLIDMWKEEFLSLLKKYRNHPSLLFWTVNNEMKFYDNEPDLEKAKMKMTIISDVVKEMRKIDPTRPICFDSNYQSKGKKEKFGESFFKNIDDGDIDDVHAYINWYDYTIFKQFKGEFQQKFKMPGRPLISQEMSTGYPNNETGHPTRFYTLVHQNPQTLVGYQAYAFGDPNVFLKVQSFITGELAEALRRSNDQASGILHFALITWFRSVYDSQKIEPYPTYYALQRALQPVLVSAELWGRHFYAGTMLPTRICVVNDREDGLDVKSPLLYWELQDSTGKKLSWGKQSMPDVKHYSRQWLTPSIQLPDNFSGDKNNMKLVLKLTENGIPVSHNEYEVLVAKKRWNQLSAPAARNIVLVDFNNTAKVLDFLGISYEKANTLADALKKKANLYVFAGINTDNCTSEELKTVRMYLDKGGKVLLLNAKEAAKQIYPEYIIGWIRPTEGDIVNLEMPESPVFDGIDLLELRYFNDNQREVPTVCDAALQINRNEKILELANQTKIHGYINGDMEARSKYMKTIKGFTILQIQDKGEAIVSTMLTEKATTDPIAGKLLVNMIDELLK
ncbi:glycoside hydrolase family 2 TIM barrel-domain containing protein [uncultured Bacteroides sp.]|uniref:glycoside hydrolase family 2 protein n=1 Tax=uncultured Bacteroides sp. TaxID=162156 RepID=UPI002AA61E61|nr:glycoside hydrolase family 2 TIM barrel-domain containing protein [uncultured Bacteroides sp.]